MSLYLEQCSRDLLIDSIQCSVYVDQYFTQIKRLKMFRKHRGCGRFITQRTGEDSEGFLSPRLIDFLTFWIGNAWRGTRLPELFFDCGGGLWLQWTSQAPSVPFIHTKIAAQTVRQFHQGREMRSEMAADSHPIR